MPYIEVLQKYAVFSGRAKRTEYWLWVLFTSIIEAVLLALSVVIGEWFLIVAYLYVLATVIPSLAVGARRLHDTRRSGWWQLIGLVPLIGPIVLLIFFVMGSDDDNQYGPRPA
jgi:uncharacterized membrane protein YhaH (DUF805 family)